MSEAGFLLKTKSMDLAVRIVNLYKWLIENRKEFVLSKQLLRSGTSVGANISEAQAAISKADFASKIYIAAKECRETQYWVELLFKTNYMDERQYNSINDDISEMGKLLTSITKKMQPNGH